LEGFFRLTRLGALFLNPIGELDDLGRQMALTSIIRRKRHNQFVTKTAVTTTAATTTTTTAATTATTCVMHQSNQFGPTQSNNQSNV